MPADVTPITYLSGCNNITADGSGGAADGSFTPAEEYFCIPLSDLPGAISADIDAGTGDIRKIIFALETALYTAYQGLATEDRPTKWLCNRSSSVSDSSGILTRNFVNQFSTELSGEEVVDEP